MFEYSLFRAKFIKPRQKSLLDENLTAGQLFLQALEERLSAELRKGYIWHIGNVQYFSPNTGYFAIGRTTNSTIEKFDEISGNFIEEELEESPYTHCVFDSNIGFIGIAKKPTLTQTTKGIANRVEELLSIAEIIKRNGVTVEIVPIPDPDGFLKLLLSAYRVFRFITSKSLYGDLDGLARSIRMQMQVYSI